MTIAACFLSTEGVVLGADSTVTLPGGKETRYFNNEQKLFEIGAGGSLGLNLWGSVPMKVSYRTIVATFADLLRDERPTSVRRVAERWAAHVWSEMRTAHRADLELAQSADEKRRKGVDLTDEEDGAASFVDDFETGFCIGGHCDGGDRASAAYEVEFSLGSAAPPIPKALEAGQLNFWGVPNMFRRLLDGVDWRILDAILDAKNAKGAKLWGGTENDLYDLAFEYLIIVHSGLPIREAIDLVHFSIEATIKALKFSHYADPTCGGPIEIAVITSDRPFRWVRHKGFDSAI